jgi:predicted SnoaL-like aldol condensation-catalyzing enzyme
LKIDIGLEKDAPNLAQSFFDVRFIEDSTAAQAREGLLEFFTELVKHSPET